jgi:hypothetical protein
LSVEDLRSGAGCLGLREELTLLGESIQLAIRIAIVWAAGMLIAVTVRALMPDQMGINLTGRESTLFIPFSRMGYWTCVLAALIVTGMVVFRAMIADVGWSSLR